MAVERYYYNYAIVDRASKMCVEVRTCTYEASNTAAELYIRIPSYDDSYMFKYYDEETGKWYYDAALTQEWTPAE